MDSKEIKEAIIARMGENVEFNPAFDEIVTAAIAAIPRVWNGEELDGVEFIEQQWMKTRRGWEFSDQTGTASPTSFHSRHGDVLTISDVSLIGIFVRPTTARKIELLYPRYGLDASAKERLVA